MFFTVFIESGRPGSRRKRSWKIRSEEAGGSRGAPRGYLSYRSENSFVWTSAFIIRVHVIHVPRDVVSNVSVAYTLKFSINYNFLSAPEFYMNYNFFKIIL